jgi:4-hydroxy-tetrahydrodipicolinate synthase
MRIQGPVFAIVTPFNAAGEVDYGALDDYLCFLAHCGVQNIVVNGTTGEFASLTTEERQQVLERCRKNFSGVVINHISACSTRDCRTLFDHGRDHADAALLLPPFYYAGIDEAGCTAFMREVLGHGTLPVYLYNFPEHTQCTIGPDMFRSLSKEFAHLAGIKDSGGNLQVSQAYKEAAPGSQVFVGSDRWALDVLRRGLDGSVTGCGNPTPEFLVRLHSQWMAGDEETAARTQQAFDVWTTFREGVPINHLPLTKAALGARIPKFPPHVRPPFVDADEASVKLIRSRLQEIIVSS